ncbi:MAG: hypothetical protein ACLRZ2_04245 [Veillonella sp.]
MADTKSLVDEILKRVLMRIDSADLAKLQARLVMHHVLRHCKFTCCKSTTNFYDY